MRTTRALLISLVAVFAFSAIAAVSASATEPVWWVGCHQVTTPGTGAYGNNTCTTPGGSKEFSRKLLAGEKAFFKSEQASNKVLKAAGVTITCLKEVDKGELIGGKPGKDVTSAKYTECTVTGAAGCKVVEPIELVNVRSTLVWKHRGEFLNELGEKEGAPNGEVLDRFEPAAGGGKVFVQITLKECTNPILNGAFPVENEVLAEVGFLVGGVFKPANALAAPPEEAVNGYLNFPCPPLEEYWTGDELTRAKHNKTEGTPLFTPLTFLGAKAEYCELTKVWLVTAGGVATGESWGVTNE